MTKAYRNVVLLAITILAALFQLYGAREMFVQPHLSTLFPEADTIYKYDTVYEYLVVYDTVYIEDEKTVTYDSVTTSNPLNMKDTLQQKTPELHNERSDTLKKHVSLSGFSKQQNKRINDLDDESSPNIKDAPQIEGGKQVRNLKNGESLGLRRFVQIPFAFYVKDTLYLADTLVIFENEHDTVFYFQLSPKTDTSFVHQTIIRNRPNLVIINEIVNVRITKRNYTFVDDTPVMDFYKPVFELVNNNLKSGKYNENNRKTGVQRKRTNSMKNRFRTVNISNSSNFRNPSYPSNSNRYNDDQYLFLKAGGNLIFPHISFKSGKNEFQSNIDILNKNISSEPSAGINAGFLYYNNNIGFESGMNYVKHRFSLNHEHSENDIDTSYYWKYFDSEKYEHDTTWYLDINTWLATGDTVFIPHIDSTLISITDSTLTVKYDTSTIQVPQTHILSFSYIEIPLIFRYPVINGRFFCDAAIGVIPSFLISKSGKILSPDSGTITENKDVTFDYNINVSLYGSLSMGIKMSERWAFLAEPYIRKTVASGLRNQQMIMNTDSWGIQFAITFRF